jgi:hypothetical protein
MLDPVKLRSKENVWPPNRQMLEIIEQIIHSNSPCPEKPEFCFEMKLEAVKKNFLTLKRHNLDLGAAVQAQSKSPVGYGSEFWKPSVLAPLLGNHPLWALMKAIPNNGPQWLIDPITKEERIGNVKEALKFGNHKGATSQPDLLLQLVSGDEKYGYAIPLLINKVSQIPHICMAPLNIQAQWTINELGEIVEKDCLTHNQSFIWENSGMSINSRSNPSSLQKCMFGKCLLRIINWIITAQTKYPNCRIFAKKDNFKSAYRRCHLHWETALKTVTQIPGLQMILIYLRLTFGEKFCPNVWCTMSELMCDLTTAILHNDEWDPTFFFGQNQHLVPPARWLDNLIPFGKGPELIVNIEINPRGTNDIYIDDLVLLTAEIEGTDNFV